MKKIKVAFISAGLGYVNRGVEIKYTEIVKELSQKPDMEISLFGLGKDLKIKNVDFFKIFGFKRKFFTNFPKIKRLYLKRNHDYESCLFSILVIPFLLFKSFDIIVFSSFPFNLLALKIYRKIRNSKVKFVYLTDGGSAFTVSRHAEADKVVAINPDYKELFGKKFDSVLIPNGFNKEIFYPRKDVVHEDLNLPKDKFIIFSSSALDKVKRIDFLIKTVSKIPDSHLVIAGNGTEENNLKQRSKELMNESVTFLGSIDQEKLAQYYSIADIFVLPSLVEPFGMVIIEAMACKTPVITNDSNTQKWIVGDGGSCIDMSSEDRLIEEIEKYQNKDFNKDMGEKAFKNVHNRFLWKTIAADYYKVFKEFKQLDDLT